MSKEIVPQEILESKILVIRGHKVMLDRDLAALYGVETRALNPSPLTRFDPPLLTRIDPPN